MTTNVSTIDRLPAVLLLVDASIVDAWRTAVVSNQGAKSGADGGAVPPDPDLS